MPREGKKNAPRTRREWEVFRMGVREGIVRAQQDAEEKADQFLLRFDCNGVELSTPSAGDAERVKTPAESTPATRKRGAA